jgi:Zn-dependent protease
MSTRFRIGSLLGFPIEVNLSFLLLLGVVLVWMGGLAGVFAVLVAFASVLLHELGHAVVARHLGVPVPSIELHFFGGAAKLGGQPRSAGDEIAIAAAGPAVSFALGGLGLLLFGATGIEFFQLLGWINLTLGAFNLVPALPMDGGRILRALLAQRMSYLRATEISIQVARGFAVLFGLFGLLSAHLYLVLLAVMLWSLGSVELRVARLSGGYTHGNRGSLGRDDVEVLPRDYRPGSEAQDAPSGFVVRRAGNRIWIEYVGG